MRVEKGQGRTGLLEMSQSVRQKQMKFDKGSDEMLVFCCCPGITWLGSYTGLIEVGR